MFSQFVDHLKIMEKHLQDKNIVYQYLDGSIVRMVTSGTIEEQIQELHNTKRELADSVLSSADSPKLDIETMVRLLKG